MSKLLTFTMELHVEVPDDFTMDAKTAQGLKYSLEEAAVPELAAKLYDLGTFTDKEVVKVSLTEEHDTKQ